MTGTREVGRTARGRLGRMAAWLAAGIVAALGVYYAGAAYVIAFDLDSVLFPHMESTDSPAPVAARITDSSGSELLLRRYGQPRRGCAIFFPGQHGELASYRQTLFRKLVDAGVAVFAVDYPGQDGAAGSATLGEMPLLSRRAALVVARQCGDAGTVILGRSLGSMVASYAAEGLTPAGMVLDSAAPSLSAAIAGRLRSRAYLRPLALLPIRFLLPHDYSLAEALAPSPYLRVVVFQGTADRLTPIGGLERVVALRSRLRLIPVPGAIHTNTYRLAPDAYVAAVVAFLADPVAAGHAP